MRHPGETDLALYAGGELGLIGRWRLRRHVRNCASCQREVDVFARIRAELATSVDEMPAAVNWGNLAGEMRGNIHVGLAAGECVGPIGESGWPGLRHATAAALAVVLVLTAGWWLQMDRPRPSEQAVDQGIVLSATADGIELRDGGRLLSLQHPDARNVTYTVNAQGGIRARYVDRETGQVTVNHVYAE